MWRTDRVGTSLLLIIFMLDVDLSFPRLFVLECLIQQEISEFSCFVCTLVKQFRKKLPQGPDEHLTPELLGTLTVWKCEFVLSKGFKAQKSLLVLNQLDTNMVFCFVYLFVTVTTQIG